MNLGETDNVEFKIKKFSYANDGFCIFLRACVLTISILFLVNFLITANTINIIAFVLGFIAFAYLLFGDYFKSFKAIDKRIIIKSVIDSYDIDVQKIKTVSIIGISQKNGTKDYLFEFLDEDGELAKVKVKSVINSKKLEEFFENNKIKILNTMKRNSMNRPIRIIASVVIIVVVILAFIYSVRVWSEPRINQNNLSDYDKLNLPPITSDDKAVAPQTIGIFPLNKISVEETGFNVDEVFLNSRKLFVFSTIEKNTYNFAYTFSSNVKESEISLCFDLDCKIKSTFLIKKEKLLTENAVTFAAGSNSPLNNFQLQTSIIEVMGLVVLSIGQESFDDVLYPILKVEVLETDNNNQKENFSYDINM
ncbi:MAG TPA: hypothetical protein PLX15_04880 [Candidatus Woesearchaeota archaeon]|nr:hypothetical protein [Candidatus Woesearchaeota archaeon]